MLRLHVIALLMIAASAHAQADEPEPLPREFVDQVMSFRPATPRPVRRPIDDLGMLGPLAQRASLGQFIGIVRVDSAQETGCLIYQSRVTLPLWRLEEGQRIAFLERIRSPDEDRRFVLHPQPADSYPKMKVGESYLVTFRSWGDGDGLLERHSRAIGWRHPVVGLGAGATISANARNVTAIIPDLQQLMATQRLPEPKRPAALRRWVMERLDTKHDLLRTLVLLELTSNELGLYPGTTAAEAARLADLSVNAGWARFGILRNLALHTPHPMDHWYLRAVTRGSPNRVHPDDALTVATFTDSIEDVVHRLSIDSFWSILERPTRYVSPWVHAFAKKRDPRLLPIILRHLEPDHVDESVVEALAHYRGMPVVEAAVIRLARDTKIRADDRARAAVRESLRQIGTSRALAAAAEIPDDASSERDPGREP